MPTTEEVEKGLSKIAEYVEDIGHVLISEDQSTFFRAKPNEEIGSITLRGHHCSNDDDEHYYILAHEELRQAYAVYYLSIQQNLAQLITEEEAQAIVEDAELAEEGDEEMIAASLMLENSDIENSQTFESNFTLITSGEGHYINTQQTENGRFRSYAIEARMYPYEDDFSIADFDEAVTAVIGVGQKSAVAVGQNLRYVYDEEVPSKSHVQFNTNH